MNRSDHITVLARRNKRKHALRVLRERLDRILGYELPEEAFWDDIKTESATNQLWESWQNVNAKELFGFRLEGLPEEYVVTNKNRIAEFGSKVREQEVVLYLNHGAEVHFDGTWCVSIGTDVFSHVAELIHFEGKSFCVSSPDFDNYFLLDLYTVHFSLDDCRLVWDMEIWGEQWSEVAHVIFA